VTTKRVLVLVLVLVFLVGMVSGCGQGTAIDTAPERDYYKIGVITCLSGELTYGGHITRRGYEMWAEAVNAKGGIDVGGTRYRVELVFADAQSNPATGADAVERLIVDEKVDLLLGPYSSSVTLAVAPIAEKYGVPHITGSAESPIIWKEGFRYTFGTIPACNLIATSPIETLAALSPKPKSIFIVAADDAFSKAVGEAYESTARKHGIEVLKFEVVPKGIDYSPLISSAASMGAEILAIGGHIIDHIEAVKASKELDYNPLAFVHHYGITAADFYETLGPDAEYIYGASVWEPDVEFSCDLFGSTSEYVEMCKVRWGTTPDYTAAGSTAAGIAFQRAIEIVGATPPLSQDERDQIVEALEALEIMTFYGPVNFADEGEFYHCNTGLQTITIQIQDGKPITVGPPHVRVAAPRYPTPAWDRR